jgi:hypothetical protein
MSTIQNNTRRNNNTRTTMTLGNMNNTKNTMSNNSNKSLLNTAKQQVSSLSPMTIFIIVLIILVLGYIAVNYIYARVVSERSIQVASNVLVDTITDGMVPLEIGSAQLPNSSYSNEYALSLWVYVEDFNYRHGERKFILRRGDIKSVVNPEIYLHPTQNTLQVNVSLATDASGNVDTQPTMTEATTTTVASGSASAFKNVETFVNNDEQAKSFENTNMDYVSNLTETVNGISQNYNNGYFNDVVNDNIVDYPNQPAHHKNIKHNPELNIVLDQFADAPCECDDNTSTNESVEERKAFEESCGKCFVENFPLQKWVHLVISQYNNVLDIYVDGKLRSSCSLPGFPDVTTDNLVLSPDGGFSGQVGSTVYYNTALSANDVYKVYIKGPEGSRNTGIIERLTSIPTWVYAVVVVMILALVGYSIFM